MDTDRDAFDGQALADYVATLLPLQQQAIATAQLAGCRFERRSVERHTGIWRPVPGDKISKWITTTQYEAFLPDGTSCGVAEDIYECALIALSILDTPHGAPRRGALPDGAFALRPDNEV
jgi:hypothetical protein